jgi:H(+)-translocating pyrophosphatase
VTDDGEIDTSVNKKVVEISDAIARGARAFLLAEYKYMFIFLVVFGVLVLLAVGSTIEADPDDFSGEFKPWVAGALSMVAFVMGGVTSIASGYVGMMIAVQANSRTALQAQRGYVPAFRTAFRAGAVLGFALCGLALIVLFILIMLFQLQFSFADSDAPVEKPIYTVRYLFETIASYGFGGSSIALFGRVGGGIYTKAADVGADLVGKVEQGIPEDDPRNPAVIADNVGDNVGDVAGMGADLFGSFAEASCAALVIASDSSSGVLVNNWNSMLCR